MEICYLLAFPDPVETPQQPIEQIKGLKDAPYFQQNLLLIGDWYTAKLYEVI
jgi:hypothetical protein